METILSILSALTAIPKIGQMIEKWLVALLSWWNRRKKAETKAMIEEAKTLEQKQKAQTQAGRKEILDAWQKVLHRKRYR